VGKYGTLGSAFDRIFRNTLNKALEDVDTDINAQKKRVDDLIKGTPQPSEVVDARGGFPVLSGRLNDLSSSVAQKANQADLTTANNTVALKADKTYVDTQVQAVASGSPKGTYATLTALQTAFPTGNSNIYLVTADGKWYYWNGVAWAAGGVYQGTSNPDNSITPAKLTFVYNVGSLLDGSINIDTVAKTFTAVTGTSVSDLTGFYSVNNANTAISYSSVASAFPIYLFFNKQTLLLHMEARWYVANSNELLLCVLYGGKLYQCMSLDKIQVNSKYQGIIPSDNSISTTKLQDNSVTEAKTGFTYLYGCLIDGGINIDTVAKTVTAVTGTSISDLTGFYAPSNLNTTVAYIDTGYPMYLYFNKQSLLIHMENRWFAYNHNELLLCIVYQNTLFNCISLDKIQINNKYQVPKAIMKKENVDIDSIQARNIDFVSLPQNKLDITKITPNTLIGLVNNKITYTSNASYHTTHFMPVKAGVPVIATPSSRVYVLTDRNYNVVEYNDTSFTTPRTITPSVDGYLQISYFNTTSYLNMRVYEGNVDVDQYILTMNNLVTSKWVNKKWTSYGDSITYYGNWQPFVAKKLGLIHTKKGLTGSTISDYSVYVTPMCDDSRLNDISADSNLITIMGGTNDWAAEIPIGTINDTVKTTYIGGYKYIIESILTRIPSCQILLMTPPFGFFKAGMNELNDIGLSTADYGDAVKEIGKYYNLPVLDVRHEQGINKLNWNIYMDDEPSTVHMNAEGGKRLAGIASGRLITIEPE
jgi:lysophospholipase L1-like esterase